jgi:type IV pilus assembly protein PilW
VTGIIRKQVNACKLYLLLFEGFTLIEMLLALLLGTFLLGVLTTTYISAKQTLLANAAINALQDTTVMAEHFIRQAVQKAGYIGCVNLINTLVLPENANIMLSPANKILPFYDSFIKAGTDAFTVQGAAMVGATLLEMSVAGEALQVATNNFLKEGEIAIIADCEKAELFTIQNLIDAVDRQTVIPVTPLKEIYGQGAKISLFEKNTYYIHETDRKDKQGVWYSALYLVDIHNHKKELLEGVSGMTLTYAQNTSKTLVSARITLKNPGDFVYQKTVFIDAALRN